MPSSNRFTPDEVKAILKRDWSEALEVEIENDRDNFFDLGGDSLAAMRVISRIRSRFDVEVGIEFFFYDEANIARMAKHVSQLLATRRA